MARTAAATFAGSRVISASVVTSALFDGICTILRFTPRHPDIASWLIEGA
jgi:hypothetical protein